MICWVALTALLAVACTPDNPDGLDGGAVPKAADLDITIDVDQTSNLVTFRLNNRGMVPVWIFSQSDIVTSNPCERRYRKAGTYSVEVKAYNANGTSDGSVVREFVVEHDYSTTNPLYGAGSKSWVVDAATAAHFGCGESVENPTGWYAAQPNEKAGSGLYENVLTFKADGTYEFEAGEGGRIFVNAGVTLIGADYNTAGADFSMPWNDYASTYEYTDGMLVFPQQQPQYTVVGYVPNDAYLTGSTLEFHVTNLTDEVLEIVWFSETANNGGPIAWYMRYVPQGGAVAEKDPLYGTGSKTWKIASGEAGHLGCGESAENPAGWYAAQPDEKAGKGIYDDRITFTEDGKYVYDPGEDGKTFVNVGCTVFDKPADATEDFDIDNTRQETTYTIDDERTTLTLPANTFLPYVAADAMYAAPVLTIKELTSGRMVLVWVAEGIAWQLVFIPEDAGGDQPDVPDEPGGFEPGALLEPTEYKDFLVGSWTWEASTMAHFGCGESVANPTNWWSGPADAKAGCSMYDDVMTFGADGSYTFDPVDGMTYMNAGVTAYTGAVVDSPLGDDFRVEAVMQRSTYTYAATTDSGYPAFTLPENVLFSYIASDDQLGAFRTYYITAMWENQVEISWYTPTGNGGGAIAWRYRLKRVAE